MADVVKLNTDQDLGGRTFIECQVDDEMIVRVYSDFTMEVFDPNDSAYGGFEIPLDRFKRSFEELMKAIEEKYGRMP